MEADPFEKKTNVVNEFGQTVTINDPQLETIQFGELDELLPIVGLSFYI